MAPRGPALSKKAKHPKSGGGREGYEIVSDPFVPFPDEPGIQEERLDRILRFRAVFVGCALGALVNASNIYLGRVSFGGEGGEGTNNPV